MGSGLWHKYCAPDDGTGGVHESRNQMAKRDIVVVGASAGGVEALKQLAKGLPADLPAAIFVVLHMPASGTSALPRILNRYGALPAELARDGEPIQSGRIYVAPPDVHLLVERDHVAFSRAPRENGFRPAIDPLFRSAARAYGPRAVGVILSGTGDDGTLGLIAIKERGGLAVVQNPTDALFPGMPKSAIQAADVDAVLPIEQIPTKLAELADEEVPDVEEEREPAHVEGNREMATPNGAGEGNGKLTTLTCPECGGVLREVHEHKLTRYRCRIGHIYSPERLMIEKSNLLEHALWAAVQALDERSDLSRRLARRMRQANCPQVADRFDGQRAQTEHAAEIIRQVLMTGLVSDQAVAEAVDEAERSGSDANAAG